MGRQELHERLDRNEWIADFVSQARSKETDRGELLGVLGLHREVSSLKCPFDNGN